MLAKVGERLSDDAVEGLPTLAWLFLAVAFAPHLLAVAGADTMATIVSTFCFPASMGPLALAHAHILVSRLGFTSHMAWISALLFSTLWSVLLYWFWGKSRAVAFAIGATCFVGTAGCIWLILLPLM